MGGCANQRPGHQVRGTWHLGGAGHCRLLPEQLLPHLPLCPHWEPKPGSGLQIFRSGRGTLRDLWPQAPEDEEVQPGGGLSGPREEEDVKKQGPPAVAWAGSSLSAATMHLPRGREQAGDCTGVCWAHWYRGEPVHGQWGALTRPPGTEVSVQVRGPPAPQAGSGLSPGR